ncbi:MAG: hypothetical protein K2I95_00295 [Treponemataceae bacterium]|nr:hypothetical protein [Treponemataceae bacterium]
MKNTMKKIKTIMMLAIIAMIVSCSNSSSGSEEKSNDKNIQGMSRDEMIQEMSTMVQEMKKYKEVTATATSGYDTNKSYYNNCINIQVSDAIYRYENINDTSTLKEVQDTYKNVNSRFNNLKSAYDDLAPQQKRQARPDLF